MHVSNLFYYFLVQACWSYALASPSHHVKRSAETNATLYAYGVNASSWPIAYGLDDGMCLWKNLYSASLILIPCPRPLVYYRKPRRQRCQRDPPQLGSCFNHRWMLDCQRNFRERHCCRIVVHWAEQHHRCFAIYPSRIYQRNCFRICPVCLPIGVQQQYSAWSSILGEVNQDFRRLWTYLDPWWRHPHWWLPCCCESLGRFLAVERKSRASFWMEYGLCETRFHVWTDDMPSPYYYDERKACSFG